MVSFLVTFGIWALLHSLTAATPFKKHVRGRVGSRAYEGLYRLVYNFVSGITFLPVLYLAAVALPNGRLWSIPWPFRALFFLLQAVGAVGLFASLRQTGLLQFAGLGQAVRYFQGKEDVNPPPRLVTGGTYALVRHPLYSFSLLLIWFVPTMTWSTFIFNLAATVYFWIGSIYEERRLRAEFGEAYRRYSHEVPRLIPVRLRQIGERKSIL